ncbi:hypothetical protein QBC35DRAFT_252304 [Podospora australis]|uniref:Uncharacterized protein n=1 Tax=Podospora australis TaxID=1536484 RepID=A0AAN6WT11_9PEZI|nr:hypothetical protein QBC35DRAFT_252304 [Podospora australis]
MADKDKEKQYKYRQEIQQGFRGSRDLRQFTERQLTTWAFLETLQPRLGWNEWSIQHGAGEIWWDTTSKLVTSGYDSHTVVWRRGESTSSRKEGRGRNRNREDESGVENGVIQSKPVMVSLTGAMDSLRSVPLIRCRSSGSRQWARLHGTVLFEQVYRHAAPERCEELRDIGPGLRIWTGFIPHIITLIVSSRKDNATRLGITLSMRSRRQGVVVAWEPLNTTATMRYDAMRTNPGPLSLDGRTPLQGAFRVQLLAALALKSCYCTSENKP